MKCPNCGNLCQDNDLFCNNCGSKLTLPEQPPQQPQQVFQQSQNTGFEVPKKSNNKLIAIILIIVGLFIVAAGAFVVLDGFDIIYAILDGFNIMEDELDLFSIVGSGDDKDEDDKDKVTVAGITKDADAKEEATTAASDAEKPKPVETTVATETTTRYEIVTEAIATEAVATEAVATDAVATEAASRPDSGAYDDYDWEEDVDRYLTLLWEMAELAYEYMDVPDEDLPQDVQDRFTAIEDEIEELEYRIYSFMEVCDDEIYYEIMEMMNDEFADMAEKYPEIFE